MTILSSLIMRMITVLWKFLLNGRITKRNDFKDETCSSAWSGPWQKNDEELPKTLTKRLDKGGGIG
jgi:hypothetical protein